MVPIPRKSSTDFDEIDFLQVCEFLKNPNFFMIFFYGSDDLNDHYFTILWDNRDWIAKGFETPTGELGLLVEKNKASKKMLVDYIDELGHKKAGYETIHHWDDLIMVVFDGDYHVIESTIKKKDIIKYADYFKANYDSVFNNLGFPDL